MPRIKNLKSADIQADDKGNVVINAPVAVMIVQPPEVEQNPKKEKGN